MIRVFTDGAVPNNQNKNIKKTGGIGVFFGDNDIRNISMPITDGKVTNMVCETMACIKALEKLLDEKDNITIYTDSMYIVNSMTKWAKNWEKNNWKKSDGKVIENIDLIKRLYFLTTSLNVKYNHVKAHMMAPPKESNEYFYYYGNHMADKLATQCIL